MDGLLTRDHDRGLECAAPISAHNSSTALPDIDGEQSQVIGEGADRYRENDAKLARQKNSTLKGA